jgi:trehalose 6-phosphate phosphatase
MMTTQNNVVTPEIKSCINNLISTTVLPSATTVPESMAMLGGFLNFSHNNNLIKRLEGSKVNAWIDSMRASSPTRTKHGSENRDQTHWTVSIIIY